MLATRTQSVGRLPAANGRSMQVQKIRRVTLLSLHSDCEWGPTSSVVHRRLPLCPFHELTQAEPEVDHHVISTNPVEEGTTSSSSSSSVSQSHQQTHMGKTWHSIKSTSGRLINRASSTMASAGGSASSVSLSIPTNETAFERMKRRILNEIVKMFNESDSFYFSEDSDLSQCLQRSERKAMQSNRDTQPMNSSANPLLESIMTADSGASNELATSDDRFFFNRHMLSFLNDQDSNARPWLIPVIQGFVQIERCRLPPTDPLEPELLFDLALVSRRSRHRAGTRYKRRGTDEQGHAANFVESEQLLCTSSGHVLSFVQTRGSVPVHWAQPGVSYRPAPVLERSSADNRESFRRHFERELAEYGPVTAINLVEQSGREKVLADAYLNHVLDLDEPKLTYVSFDFHEIWLVTRRLNFIVNCFHF